MSIHPNMGSSADRNHLLRRIEDLKSEIEQLRAATYNTATHKVVPIDAEVWPEVK